MNARRWLIAAAVIQWSVEFPGEYQTYLARDEWVADLEDFERCIFLDLIDHSESN